jgi:hypothetical protein
MRQGMSDGFILEWPALAYPRQAIWIQGASEPSF